MISDSGCDTLFRLVLLLILSTFCYISHSHKFMQCFYLYLNAFSYHSHTHSHDGCVRDNIRLSIAVIQENWSPDFLIDRQPILPHEPQSPNSLQLVLHNLFQLYSNDNEPAIEEVVLKFVCSLLEERGPLRVGRGCASHVCYVVGPSHVRCCVVLYPYIVFTQC